RKSGWCLYFHSGTARRKRDDGSLTVHPDGTPEVHHRAERLHSRKDFSRPRNAVGIVSGFRAEQRPANTGRSRGREASGRACRTSGRSSRGRRVRPALGLWTIGGVCGKVPTSGGRLAVKSILNVRSQYSTGCIGAAFERTFNFAKIPHHCPRKEGGN